MTTGVSLFLIAVGAICTWAVTASVAGIDIEVVGVILMVVGGVGLLFSLFYLFGAGSEEERRAPAEQRPTREP